MKRTIAITLVGIVCTLAGCGNGNEGTVSGKVALDGKAVTGMTVSFALPGKGVGASAVLGASGEFSFPAPLPVGEYAVTLTPPVPLPPEPGQKTPPPPPTPIPPRYGQEATSGLKADVKAGRNEFGFDLTARK